MFEEKDGALALKEDLDIEQELTCVALVGIADPLREGVKDAIAQCHRSGVNVRMCTGDNIITAKAISLDAGIITKEMLDAHDREGEESYVCMEGPHFIELVGELEQEKNDEGKVINETIKNTKKFE
jgi:magnesium-transporting ATPase (P-type)